MFLTSNSLAMSSNWKCKNKVVFEKGTGLLFSSHLFKNQTVQTGICAPRKKSLSGVDITSRSAWFSRMFCFSAGSTGPCGANKYVCRRPPRRNACPFRNAPCLGESRLLTHSLNLHTAALTTSWYPGTSTSRGNIFSCRSAFSHTAPATGTPLNASSSSLVSVVFSGNTARTAEMSFAKLLVARAASAMLKNYNTQLRLKLTETPPRHNNEER